MIAPVIRSSAGEINDQFLEMLPKIRSYAEGTSRQQSDLCRDDYVAEVIANAFAAFVRLVERGKADAAFPGVLAIYAIRQVRDGRRLGQRRNIRDVTSGHCRRSKGVRLQSLDRVDPGESDWAEAFAAAPNMRVDHMAAFRVDFPAWLRRLPSRDRRVALFLAEGNTTQEAAKRFGVSEARISQLRGKLAKSWARFHAAKERRRGALAVA